MDNNTGNDKNQIEGKELHMKSSLYGSNIQISEYRIKAYQYI